MARYASPALPRIHVIATGGTIAGAQTKSGSGYRAAAFSVEALIAAVPQLRELARLDVEQVAAIGSQDMDEATWRACLLWRLGSQLFALSSRPHGRCKLCSP